MLNPHSHIAFFGIVILACSVFETAGSSIVISYTQIDNPSNIAPLISPLHSSADINNNNNNKSQTTSTTRTSPNTDNQQQLQQQPNASPVPLSIKITSHTQNQTVLANKPLKISGISSDSANSNCLVYADWNDVEPMLKANASGPNGVSDYSNWTFTYTSKYHLIKEGTNELTSKLDCGGDSVKFFTVNVTGVGELLTPSLLPNNENNNGNSLPLPISLTTDSDSNSDDDNNNNDINEISSNNNKGSGSDGNSERDGDSADQESRNIDNKEAKEKGTDKKEKKSTPSDESKKDKGPKGKNK
jgi:hypothetical protein